jgi:hypothetical protein
VEIEREDSFKLGFGCTVLPCHVVLLEKVACAFGDGCDYVG